MISIAHKYYIVMLAMNFNILQHHRPNEIFLYKPTRSKSTLMMGNGITLRSLPLTHTKSTHRLEYTNLMTNTNAWIMSYLRIQSTLCCAVNVLFSPYTYRHTVVYVCINEANFKRTSNIKRKQTKAIPCEGGAQARRAKLESFSLTFFPSSQTI